MLTLIKEYNEKDQAGKEKIENVQFEKKRTSENRMELRPVFKKINRLINKIKGVVTLGQDPNLGSSYLCKGIKECLIYGIFLHAFNPNTQKAKTSRSLSLRRVWSGDLVRTAKIRQ